MRHRSSGDSDFFYERHFTLVDTPISPARSEHAARFLPDYFIWGRLARADGQLYVRGRRSGAAGLLFRPDVRAEKSKTPPAT